MAGRCGSRWLVVGCRESHVAHVRTVERAEGDGVVTWFVSQHAGAAAGAVAVMSVSF